MRTLLYDDVSKRKLDKKMAIEARWLVIDSFRKMCVYTRIERFCNRLGALAKSLLSPGWRCVPGLGSLSSSSLQNSSRQLCIPT